MIRRRQKPPANFLSIPSCPAKAIQYAAAFEGYEKFHGVLDHPPSRMMTAADWGRVQRITNATAKILAFTEAYVHAPS
jgi:hypothetical protein